MSTLNVDNRERARVRDKKTKETILLEEKSEIFIAAVRKPVRNSSSHQGENERQRKKKVNRNTYDINPQKNV